MSALRFALIGFVACGRSGFDPAVDGGAGRGCVHQLTAYGDEICVLRDDGAVYCWGGNDQGQLGNGSKTADDQLLPGAAMISDVMQIASGEDTVCAIKTDGSLWCWGAGGQGQVGDGAGVDRATPSAVTFPMHTSAAVEVATSQTHSCARLQDGTGWCWGDNSQDELGSDETGPAGTMQLSPYIAPPLASVLAFSLGDYVTCELEPDSTVQCFGKDTEGELGDGMTTSRWQPMQLGAIPDPVISLAAGCDAHLCAATETGDVWCWGTNTYGEVGTACTAQQQMQQGSCYETLPIRVPRPAGMADAVQVTVGAYHSCARTIDDQVWCWGDDEGGQLGDGDFVTTPTPRRVVSLTGTLVDLQASCGNTFAVRDDETLLSWGEFEELGTGETIARAVPATVPIPCD